MNVETSPLEDLLIEHPSMSVYRATAPSIAPETPPPTPDAPEERSVEEDALPNVASNAPVTATPASPERAPGRSEDGQQATRRQNIHDERPRVRTEKRIVQLRSAQKVIAVNFSFLFYKREYGVCSEINASFLEYLSAYYTNKLTNIDSLHWYKSQIIVKWLWR